MQARQQRARPPHEPFLSGAADGQHPDDRDARNKRRRAPLSARGHPGFERRIAGDSQSMALLGWLWLGTPFAVIALISHDEQLRTLVAVHYTRCRAAGWTGVVMMCVGAVIMPQTLGTMMFLIGTPLSGLAVWLRDDGWDDGGEDSDVPPFDWDAFERSFWAHVRRQRRQPRRPRTPSVS